MARWRQAIELAMKDEDIERLMVVSRSRSEAASRVERAQMLLSYRQNPLFSIIRRSNAVSSGRWPTHSHPPRARVPAGALGALGRRQSAPHAFHASVRMRAI
jgi:hypothetical protein